MFAMGLMRNGVQGYLDRENRRDWHNFFLGNPRDTKFQLAVYDSRMHYAMSVWMADEMEQSPLAQSLFVYHQGQYQMKTAEYAQETVINGLVENSLNSTASAGLSSLKYVRAVETGYGLLMLAATQEDGSVLEVDQMLLDAGRDEALRLLGPGSPIY